MFRIEQHFAIDMPEINRTQKKGAINNILNNGNLAKTEENFQPYIYNVIDNIRNGDIAKYETWKKCLNENIKALFSGLVAKEYLDGELAKYETWERVNENIKSLFTSPESFTKTKATGVGQTTILKFLGGNWKQWIIQTERARGDDCLRRSTFNDLFF